MKKHIICLAFLFLFLFYLHGETTEMEKNASPNIFYNIGWNLLNSFSYNYGMNFIGAGAGTAVMIETGIDWKWRNIIYDNYWLTSTLGTPVMTVGGVVPLITPAVFLISGKISSNKKLVLAASALTQSLMLTLAVQSPLKAITGRADPGVIDNLFGYKRIDGASDFSDKFDWFNMDFANGWPSGHTANAFSAAATLSEIYHDNIWVKVGAYFYAALMGVGVTLTSHWASEVFSGALIGYAIGKTVGKSYSKFLNNNEDENPVSFYFTPNSTGIIVQY